MIGLVTHEGLARAEAARLQREGLVPPPAVAEKRRQGKRGREDRERMPPSDAHDAAEGALGHLMGDHDGGEREPGAAAKGYQDIGVSDGPGDPVMPGQVSPQDFMRPYLGAGHGAPSPGQGPPNTPHVDLRGDRGMMRNLGPFPPSAHVDGPGSAA